MTDNVEGHEADDLLRVWHERDGASGHHAVVHAAGEIDMVSAPKLDNALADVGAREIVLDLTEVTFLGSVGLSLLVRHDDRCREAGGHLRVVTGNRVVARSIAMTGLTDTLTLFDTLDEAVTGTDPVSR